MTLALYAYGAHPLLILLVVILLIGAFPAWPYSREWGYSPLGLIVVVLLALLLLGCSTPPTPEQTQAYANAAHTLVHGALIDAKDASSVYNNINH